MIHMNQLFNRLCIEMPSNYRLSGTGGYAPEIYIYDKEEKTTWYGQKYHVKQYIGKLSIYPVDNRLIVLTCGSTNRETLLDPELPDFVETLLQKIS